MLIVRLLKKGGSAAVVLPDGTLFGEGVKTRIKEHLLEECNLHTIVRLPNSVFKPYASIGTNLLFFEKGTPTREIWYYEHRVPEGQKAYSMTKPIRFEHLKPCIDWWDNREETEVAWKVTIEEVKERGTTRMTGSHTTSVFKFLEIEMLNVVPFSAPGSSQTVPPWRSANSFTVANPRPVPSTPLALSSR